jgi:hypothetical protein
MKKMKRIHICQIAILLAVLSIAINIVISYWVYTGIIPDYTLEDPDKSLKFAIDLISENDVNE